MFKMKTEMKNFFAVKIKNEFKTYYLALKCFIHALMLDMRRKTNYKHNEPYSESHIWRY